MIRKSISAIVVVATLSLTVTGCTQMPTEKQGVVDLRPQLSFKIADENAARARVLVDGLDMGQAGDYLEGKAALRVLSGNHMLVIQLDGRTIAEEKLYVGDGINRTILVK